MHITTEDAAQRIKALFDNGVSLKHAKLIDLLALPAAGKNSLNNALIRVAENTYGEKAIKKIVTVTDRRMRPHEVDGKDYRFVTKEQFDKLELLTDSVYSIGKYRYGTSIQDIVDALKESPMFCLINSSARGAQALRQIFGEDLFGSYLKISESVWHELVYFKFVDKPYAQEAVRDRLAFGLTELPLFDEFEQQFKKTGRKKPDHVLDAIYDYTDPHQRKDPDFIAQDMLDRVLKPPVSNAA